MIRVLLEYKVGVNSVKSLWRYLLPYFHQDTDCDELEIVLP